MCCYSTVPKNKADGICSYGDYVKSRLKDDKRAKCKIHTFNLNKFRSKKMVSY